MAKGVVNSKAALRTVQVLKEQYLLLDAYAVRETARAFLECQHRPQGARAQKILATYLDQAGLQTNWRARLVELATGLGVPNDSRFEEASTDVLYFHTSGIPGNWLADQVVVSQVFGQFHLLYPTDTTRAFDTVDEAAVELARMWKQSQRSQQPQYGVLGGHDGDTSMSG